MENMQLSLQWHLKIDIVKNLEKQSIMTIMYLFISSPIGIGPVVSEFLFFALVHIMIAYNALLQFAVKASTSFDNMDITE